MSLIISTHRDWGCGVYGIHTSYCINRYDHLQGILWGFYALHMGGSCCAFSDNMVQLSQTGATFMTKKCTNGKPLVQLKKILVNDHLQITDKM